MAFSSSKYLSLLFFLMALLFPSLVLVASSQPVDACNFDCVFSFGVGKTSVSSDGLILPSASSDDQIKGSAFAAPETYVMNQDFYISHGLPPHQETASSSSLDSQIDHFLDFFVGLSMEERMEELEHTLIIINHPGLMDYKHALQVRSELIVWDLVQEVVQEIKNALQRLIEAGVSNIVVSGLKPGSLFGLETLAELHRYHLYQAVEELRMEFPGAHISHLDYIRMKPKGKLHLFTSLEVPEACQDYLKRKGHLL